MKRPITGNDHNIRRRLCEKHGRRCFYADGFCFTEEADREGVTLDRGRRAMSRGLVRSRRFTEVTDRRTVTLSIFAERHC